MSDNILESVAAELRAKREATEKPNTWLDGTPKFEDQDAVADSTGRAPVDLERATSGDLEYFKQNLSEIKMERKRLQEKERADLLAAEEAQRRVAHTKKRERQEKAAAANEARAAAARESAYKLKWRITDEWNPHNRNELASDAYDWRKPAGVHGGSKRKEGH